jgi:CRP-like cAMP-binding protein/predicted metal-dependent hydrolase/bacterioferritin-associated ferredoxin
MSNPLEELASSDFERLDGLALLARLPPDERQTLLAAAHARRFAPGEQVVREGERGDAFYVVLDGGAEAHVHADDGAEIPVGRMGPGAWFGEQALLGGPGARRTASVRATEPLRCAVIPRSLFDSHIARMSVNRRMFDAAAPEQLRQRLVRSLAAFQGLELDEPLAGSVSRVRHAVGETIFATGDPADAVYFVLEGVVLVVRDDDDHSEKLASIGPGQCFGELGVVKGQPRQASVVAGAPATLLRIEAQTFRRWYRDHPQLRDLLGTLEQVYKRGDGRRLSVFRGELEGWPTIGTVCGDPAGDCIVSTRVIGQDLLTLARGGVTAAKTERFDDADVHRELSLADMEERDGRVLSAEIVGITAKTIRPDVGELVRHVVDRVRVPGSALARFRKSGHLGGEVDLRDPTRLCSCMRLGRADVLRAAEEHGATLDAVRAATGAAALCGACVPDICAVLAEARSPTTASEAVMQASRAEVLAGPAPPRVSLPDLPFDPDALEAMRGIPEFHFMAVASVFAPTGERFMIRAISRALPSITDPSLVAHIEAFLAQEANHIAAHAPLNTLLLERIYPRSPALHRLAKGRFGHLERLPLRLAVAVCAAFECIADASFVTFFERYYGEGGRKHHPDPEIHDLAVRSGIADLFHWHGAEELGHRHVAFATMQALRTPYPVRVLGFLILGTVSFLGLLPALWSLRRYAKRPLASAPRGTTALIALRAFAFLWPWFHPGTSRYGFLEQLERDAARYPSA